MDLTVLKQKTIATPAFIYDLDSIKGKLQLLHSEKTKRNIKLLYSLKALPLPRILKEIKPFVDGFSASSLFEAKLAESVCNGEKEINFVSPGIKSFEWEELSRIANRITFNSLEQLDFFEDRFKGEKNYGIRINPEISFVKDSRYDPCRTFSKLGTPLNQIKERISMDPNFFEKIKGLHIHTNCESTDFSQLTQVFLKIKSELGGEINNFKWINLGGGYLFDQSKNLSLFYELTKEINQNYDEVIIEPGNFIVQDSGYLVSSVIDLFQRNGKRIAVLDTTVNHVPEVFEYQYEPDVLETSPNHENEYMLAGCSCLSGDIFGTYCFENKLDIGSKVIFSSLGSYSLVKAHTFNGINLPDLYCLENKTRLEKIKSYTFKEYMNHYGA